MNIFNWLRLGFTSRGKALLLYRRGMARAGNRDGAISAYTAAIDMPGAPSDIRAMALYNRALVHLAAGDDRNGVGDPEAVLGMGKGLANVRTMARKKLARMKSRSGKTRLHPTENMPLS